LGASLGLGCSCCLLPAGLLPSAATAGWLWPVSLSASPLSCGQGRQSGGDSVHVAADCQVVQGAHAAAARASQGLVVSAAASPTADRPCWRSGVLAVSSSMTAARPVASSPCGTARLPCPAPALAAA
jgi:hypothetical protein